MAKASVRKATIDSVSHVGGEAGMPPGEELDHQLLRDGLSLDDRGEQALAEQGHETDSVPLGQLTPGAVLCPGSVGGEQVEVGVPLQEISRGGHADDDAGASVVATREPDQLLDGFGSRASQLCEQLAAAAEQGTQQARDGQHHVAVGDFREDLLAQPLGPEKLLSRGGSATRSCPRRPRSPRSCWPGTSTARSPACRARWC
jgi:hypothetical protein